MATREVITLPLDKFLPKFEIAWGSAKGDWRVSVFLFDRTAGDFKLEWQGYCDDVEKAAKLGVEKLADVFSSKLS